MAVMDTLSRLTHDSDVDVARAALLGLGIIGAGTNNARLAGVRYFDKTHCLTQWLLH